MGQAIWADGMVVRQSAQSRTPRGWSVGSPRVRAVQLEPNKPFLVPVRLMLMMVSRRGFSAAASPQLGAGNTGTIQQPQKSFAMHENLYSNSNREITRKGLVCKVSLNVKT